MGLSKTVRVVTAAALSLAFSACHSDKPPASQKGTLTRTELFDLRTKCSELARRVEDRVNSEKKKDRAVASDMDSFTNRYDPEANRCYVEQFTNHYQKANNGEDQVMQYRSVADAQENVTLVSCSDYVHPSGPRQTNCTDKDFKSISVSAANLKMNTLMGESVNWP